MDAPDARRKFGEGLARVIGCRHMSGLLMRRMTAAGPYGSKRTGSTSMESALGHVSYTWLTDPVSRPLRHSLLRLPFASWTRLVIANGYAVTTGAL